MARESVRKALDNQLSAYVPIGLTSLPIAWENIDFTPTTGKPYIAQHDLVATPAIGGIGKNAPVVYLGIYRLRVFYPAGIGAGVPMRQADGLVNHFKRGTPLEADGLPVYIKRTWRGPFQDNDPWMCYPVSVEYFAYDFS